MISEYASLSVSNHILFPIFTKFSVHVVYGCILALLWHCCNMLCISGILDNVFFLQYVLWRHDGTAAASLTALLCIQSKIPAVHYWLHSVLADSECQNSASFSCRGSRGKMCDVPLPFLLLSICHC